MVQTLAGVFRQVSEDAQLIESMEAKGDEVLFVAGDDLKQRLDAIYQDLSAVAGNLK
ncbi:hypothetical protein [Microbulbifer sp. S227A]|uniref:hypothetical protein n=1 Tax=Microbulbifer sp. S227A TaxID=3415131 RepID=UPI003C7CAF8F